MFDLLPQTGCLSGFVALVAGGASETGQAVARRLGTDGACVVIADACAYAGERAADALRDEGIDAAFVPLDIADEASWREAVFETLAAHGGFDILVTVAEDATTAPTAAVLGMKVATATMKPGGDAGNGGIVITVADGAAPVVVPGESGADTSLARLARLADRESTLRGHGVSITCVERAGRADAVTEELARVSEALGLVADAAALAAFDRDAATETAAATRDIATAVGFLCRDAAEGAPSGLACRLTRG